MVVQLFIPTVGTRLVLAEPWIFDLHSEYRNETMFKILGFTNYNLNAEESTFERVQLSDRDIADIHIRNNRDYWRWANDSSGEFAPSTVKKPHRKRYWGLVSELPNPSVATALQASPKSIGTDDYFRDDEWHCREKGVANITLPANSILRIDRIYIRRGKDEYDSITFTVDDCPIPELKPKKMKGGLRKGTLRFWAKLDDVNTIRCNIL
jgi:hypothetical protein